MNRAYAALEFDDDFTREPQSAKRAELRAFYLRAASELTPPADHPFVLSWVNRPEDLDRVLQVSARLHSVAISGTEMRLAVLRPAHTPTTCGSGGCSTPVFVAVGCGTSSALSCLSEKLPDNTHAIRADTVTLIRHEGNEYLQASSCHCQGAAFCYKAVEVYGIGTEADALALEAKATWHFGTPLMEQR